MSKSFLGKGWAFPPEFDKQKGIEMVSDYKDIAQSLHILMNTSLGERVMLPEYGCNLFDYLFEPISTSRDYMIRDMIKTAIINYEPRVVLNEVSVDQSGYQDGIIRIRVDYTVRANNTRFNLVFPYYKVEGTGVPTLYSFQEGNKIRE
ncbi:MAG: hypothetical protein EP338_08935 [Bacteroidetes bacterium]|nr:MAG: hypothetical protein EP338_08935 [Bacteroidota bacterium]